MAVRITNWSTSSKVFEFNIPLQAFHCIFVLYNLILRASVDLLSRIGTSSNVNVACNRSTTYPVGSLSRLLNALVGWDFKRQFVLYHSLVLSVLVIRP